VHDIKAGEPFETTYKMREGARIDPDGNLLRFGSGLPGFREGSM
jgi:hypothetical protein